jgi:hypothetical protein
MYQFLGLFQGALC